MAKNTVPIIIGAVLFGLLAIGLTFYSLLGGGGGAPAPQANSAASPEAEQTSRVFIARRPIYPRTVITRDMLEESDTDASATAGAITDQYAIVGQLANRIIQQGQIITSDAITSGIGRVIPANIPIPAGLRGVAIWVDPDQTAAGLVDVGDRVDVIVAHDLVDGKTTAGATAVDFTAGRTIAQDLEVLAVDRSISEHRSTQSIPEAAPGSAAAPAEGEPAPPPPPEPAPAPGQQARTRIILAASPEIAQLLVTNDKQSELYITIRNPNSRDRFVIAENKEYVGWATAAPAATAGETTSPAPAATTGGGGGGGRSGRSDFDRSEPPLMPPPTFPQPQSLPPFNPGAGTPGTTPQPVPEKDVTVIRGTEKTRVIVPR